ncbi:zinc finger protein 771-like isoform X1 [Thunnus albacares]|uniref:zinc finger protein 771-like isoform X1 n=1 Tax=Thunnus albacares TaxID=8236 RepID=UPI001CF62581|nr:zinc finger protein 771-like isoform X1 [Thunnus albacares]
MFSVQFLRESINERLTAAAEEIFRVFQETISEYEKEINRQRILLDIFWKPEIKLHRIELPQQHVCKEEEVLADQQLCNQERNSSLDQEDPEPPQIKEEQEELCTSLEGEQLVLKQETETFMLTPTCDESEDQTLDLSPDETQREAEKEHVVSMSVKSSVEPEPNNDDQLLSHNSDVAESQDHKGGKHGDSGSTRKAEPKLKKRPHRKKNQTNNEDNSTTIKIHRNTDTGEQSFECDTCGKRFSVIEKLRWHLRVHSSEKPYPCDTCGKRFRAPSSLNAHMRVHTGEKPYPCTTCGRRFSDMTTVKRHIRTHTGEKPFACNICEKRFNDSSALKVHMRVHTGERPYPCNICEKRFTVAEHLKLHMRVHTGENPYKCTTCGKELRRKHNYKNHMRKHAMQEDSRRHAKESPLKEKSEASTKLC